MLDHQLIGTLSPLTVWIECVTSVLVGCLVRSGSRFNNLKLIVVIAAPVTHKNEKGRSQILPGRKGQLLCV